MVTGGPRATIRTDRRGVGRREPRTTSRRERPEGRPLGSPGAAVRRPGAPVRGPWSVRQGWGGVGRSDHCKGPTSALGA